MPEAPACSQSRLQETLFMSQSSTPTVSPSSPEGGRSHIAAGAKLSGDLSVPGLLELLGHCDGKISADSIVIDAGGAADGELHAKSIAIKGRFDGRIFGGDVKLQSGASVSGEISYSSLTIESGARVDSARFSKGSDSS